MRGAVTELEDTLNTILKEKRAAQHQASHATKHQQQSKDALSLLQKPTDLLDLLLRAHDDETGAILTDRQLHNHAMTFILEQGKVAGNVLDGLLFPPLERNGGERSSMLPSARGAQVRFDGRPEAAKRYGPEGMVHKWPRGRQQAGLLSILLGLAGVAGAGEAWVKPSAYSRPTLSGPSGWGPDQMWLGRGGGAIPSLRNSSP